MQFCLLCLVCSAVTQVGIVWAVQSLTLVRRYPGWFYKETGHFDDINESTVPDRVLCEWRCVNRDNSVGVSYNISDKSCVLIRSAKVVFKFTSTIDTELVLMRPIVVGEIRSSSKDYAFSTLEDARYGCNLIGLQLMTYGELDFLRANQTYTSCKCGFVDDVANESPEEDVDRYFPMATLFGCMKGIVGMNNCSVEPLANAYCRSP